MDFLKEYKKLIIGISIIFVIFVIVIIYSKFFTNTGYYSYSEVKKILKDAAYNYCEDNCDNLFNDNSSITITADTLTKKNYMKDLDELVLDDCSSKITISKTYNDYNYIINLECKNDYKEQTISEKLLVDNSIVTTDAGLYKMGDNKVFRGEYVNNYLKLGDLTFRIVKVNSDNTLTLVINNYNQNHSSVWDDRYNTTVDRSDGINDFSVSRAKEKLNRLLSVTYSDDILSKALNYDYCVGSRSISSTDNSGGIECSSLYRNYISLLTVYDVINASLDSNCTSIEKSKSCQNYNYLDNYGNSYWLITPVDGTTNKVYYYDDGSINSAFASTSKYLRFVITISGNEVYNSGAGTQSDPYLIY